MHAGRHAQASKQASTHARTDTHGWNRRTDRGGRGADSESESERGADSESESERGADSESESERGAGSESESARERERD